MKQSAKTLKEQIDHRKVHKPPFLIYNLLGYIWKALFVRKYRVNFTYRDDPRHHRGPYIVISNHASRVDYLYTGVAFLPHRLNFVAGYNEFFRSHLAPIFKLLQVIPKKNFVPDVNAIQNIIRIIRSGGRVILFPEGMSSISGSNQPVALGTGKLIKHLGVPVYMCHIEGGYLTNTKYCLDDRPGRVDVTISKLFVTEQLKTMSESEVQVAIDSAIHHDDYQWNKQARVAFEGRGETAKNLHTLLYRCPRCGEEMKMRGQGNQIKCLACGNGATLNEYYDLIPLDEKCLIFPTPTLWFDDERRVAREQISANPNFVYQEKVKIGMLPKRKYLKNLKTSIIVGEGMLSLSRAGLSFNGTKEGLPFSFCIPTDQVPTYGMCTDVSFFSTFLGSDYIEFYPEHESTAKWLHYSEEMHRINDGKWRDFTPEMFAESHK